MIDSLLGRVASVNADAFRGGLSSEFLATPGQVSETVCSEFVLLTWRHIRRFSAFESSAQILLVRASLLLPLISLSLMWRGFRKTKESLECFLSAAYGSLAPDARERAALTARIVRAAANHGIGHPTCLELSLATWWLLARQGIASDLRVGVRKDGGNFEAHAWVEFGGVPLSDPEAGHPHYAAFDVALASLPPAPR